MKAIGQNSKVNVCCDNLSSKHLKDNPIFAHRSKHIDKVLLLTPVFQNQLLKAELIENSENAS